MKNNNSSIMSEVKTLTRLELRNLFGINKFRHMKDQKAKKRFLLLASVWIILLLMIWGYIGGLSYGLIFLGLKDIVVPYLVLIASILILVFGFFKAGATIFSKKSYEILSSLPLHTSSVVISRFLGMYVTDLIFTYVILLPGIGVYSFLVKPDIVFYLTLVMGSLFIPMLPLVLATIIGTIINAISSRMKNASMAQTILSVIFVLAVLSFSFTMGNATEDMTPEMLMTLACKIGEIIAMIYPPAIWLQQAVIQGNLFSLTLFIGVALIVFATTILVVSVYFHKICAGLFASSASHNYRMEALKQNSLITSLYKREVKRYFASSIYVTNTIIGPIMAMVLSIGLAVAGVETLSAQLPPLPFAIESLVPFALAATFTLMTTTCVSISMEGKEVWIMKTLPVPAKSLWDSKILLNLSLIAPFYLISEIVLIFALKPSFFDAIRLILIPGSNILFALVIGITINLKIHSFDWENEAYVVKQSASAGLGGFAGVLSALVCGIVYIALPTRLHDMGAAAIIVILSALTWFFYRQNSKVKL